MTLRNQLSIDIEKIQSGVSRIDARVMARRFLADSSESSALDADLIIAFCCGVSRLDLLTQGKIPLTIEQGEAAQDLLLRRIKGEPVAYLFSKKEFYGLDFKVSPQVLIPRPDTEILVEAAIEALSGLDSPKVIDVCTGSGCIAIAIAHHVQAARVIATDISESALRVAMENAKQLGQAQIEFRLGDLLTTCLDQRQVDMIVANPPYITSADMLSLMTDVKDFEPSLALDGGEDGLGPHCKILVQSLSLLRAGGILMMEIGAGQSEILSNRVFSGFSRVRFLKDYAGIERVAKYVREG
jgi:release factor glutamine methyltransferase